MESTTKMPFGKYRGQQLEDVPLSYLKWVLANCEHVSPALLAEIRFLVSGEEPAGTTAIAIPSLANRWYRQLATEFHPDRRGGSHQAMVAVNRGRDLLLELAGVAR
jgi:hypothetical protein